MTLQRLILPFTTAFLFFTLVFTWDPSSPDELIEATYLYGATNVTGPYTIVGSVQGSTNSLSITSGAVRMFFYVTASNMWGEGPPSNTVTTAAPASSVTTLKLKVSK